jgi:hypothetical protein
MKTPLRILALLLFAGWAVADLRAALTYRLAADNKIQAQALVVKIMTENPELLTAGMHCVPPGGQAQAIVASTLNVIGKPSDPPDVEVGQHGETILSPNPKVPKLGIMLPLHDRTGKLIGALALAFRFPAGEDPVACFAKATAIRDSVAQQIPSLEALFAAAP